MHEQFLNENYHGNVSKVFIPSANIITNTSNHEFEILDGFVQSFATVVSKARKQKFREMKLNQEFWKIIDEFIRITLKHLLQLAQSELSVKS